MKTAVLLGALVLAAQTSRTVTLVAGAKPSATRSMVAPPASGVAARLSTASASWPPSSGLA